MPIDPSILSRRRFLRESLVAGTAVALASNIRLMAQTPKKLRVGLIGCGGRGRSALGKEAPAAAKLAGIDLEVVAVCDYFKGTAESFGQSAGLKPDRCFSGATGYRKFFEVPMDVALMATPPNFRPAHAEAGIAAGVHLFVEKPVAVDPVGVRRMRAVGEAAKKKGLSLVAGTQRRYDATYRKNQHLVAQGAIGKIVAGSVAWCGNALWVRGRKPEDSDADYLVRNWGNFCALSGDHIVEQHVHNLDVANWFIGRTPVSAVGFGGRARRRSGDQYDFFSIEFDYGDGCRVSSSCRQVPGCYNRLGESFVGTEGSVFPAGKLVSAKAGQLKAPDFPSRGSAYVEELAALFESIANGKPLNDTDAVCDATLTGIMGRISAYTGQMVRWVELTEKQDSPWYNLALGPTAEEFEAGNVKMPQENVAPVPGKEA